MFENVDGQTTEEGVTGILLADTHEPLAQLS